MEAVKMCVARFDEATRTGMIDAYTKIDAAVSNTPAAPADDAAAATPSAYDVVKLYNQSVIHNGNPLWLMGAKYEDKDTVKNMGAKWDTVNKRWTITASQLFTNVPEWNKYEPRPTLLGVSGMLTVAPENAPKA
jgi:hypothetical protein